MPAQTPKGSSPRPSRWPALRARSVCRWATGGPPAC